MTETQLVEQKLQEVEGKLELAFAQLLLHRRYMTQEEIEEAEVKLSDFQRSYFTIRQIAKEMGVCSGD